MDFDSSKISWDRADIITHGIDVDGVLSGAMIGNKICSEGKRYSDLSYHFIDVPQVASTLRNIHAEQSRCQSKPNNKIILCDLALNESLASLEDIVSSLSTTCQLEYYDPQHNMDADSLAKYFTKIYRVDKTAPSCATGRLVSSLFFNDDPNRDKSRLARILGDICQAADYPAGITGQLKDYNERLQDLIQSEYDKKDLTSRFIGWLDDASSIIDSTGLRSGYSSDVFGSTSILDKLWTPRFDLALGAYRKRKHEAYALIDKTLSHFDIGDELKGCIALSDDLLYMKPGIRYVIEKGEAPISVCVFKSGRIIFSKNYQSVDAKNQTYHSFHCGDLARLFTHYDQQEKKYESGGGREHGGGASLNGRVSFEFFDNVKDDVISKIVQDYVPSLRRV